MSDKQSCHSSDGINENNDIFHVMNDRNKILELINKGISVDSKNKFGATPLMLACQNNNLSIVQLLIQNKANTASTDKVGRNCLHYLCLNKLVNENLLLIARSMDCHPLTRVKDNTGKMPVEYAIMNKLEQLANYILDIDSRVDVKLLYDYNNEVVEKPSNVNRYGFFEVEGEKGELFIVKKYSHKKINQQKERNRKWERMLDKDWDENIPVKLQERVYKGVPDDYRILYWKRILGIEEINQELKEEFKRNTQIYSRSPHDKQLDLDVNRSFQFHYKFHVRYSGGQKELFYVMHAISLHDISFDYVQGISCAPSVLCIFLDELSAFAGTLKLFTSKYRLKEMFQDFNFIKKCWIVTKKLLDTRHPKIAEKFRQCGIMDQSLPFFMFEWNYLWFIHSLKFELAIRVFDVILLEGFTAMFSVSDTIFHFIEEGILNEKDPNILQQKLKNPFTLLTKPLTTNTFMSHMYKHRIDGNLFASLF
ncbi:hypothetical protein ENUP19_0296G0028 [Entamoeba nuttalli]